MKNQTPLNKKKKKTIIDIIQNENFQNSDKLYKKNISI